MIDMLENLFGRDDQIDLNAQVAIIVGAGAVGAKVARSLAQHGVGRVYPVDGKVVKPQHIPRDVHSTKYIGWNKAEALAAELQAQRGSSRHKGIDCHIDESLTDNELDDLIIEANVLVVSTDDWQVQRRVAQRARELEIPTVLPALHFGGGGEVFVQRVKSLPCFTCWDAFRPLHRYVGGKLEPEIEVHTVDELASGLCLGALDPSSANADWLVSNKTGGRRQLFLLESDETAGAKTLLREVPKQSNCPTCGGKTVALTAAAPVATSPPQVGTPPISPIQPAPQVSSPAMATSPGLDFDFGSIGGRLVLLLACLALAFFSIPLTHALISGLGIEHPSAEHPSLIGGLLLIVLALAGGFGCVAGIVGAIGAFLWLMVGLVTESAW